MPGNDQAKSRTGHREVPDSPRVSRRSVLGAAGVGAAGLAAGAFGGLGTASASPAAAKPAGGENRDRDDREDHDQQVVVHVHAGRGGELDVYHGISHTRVQDTDLAARLRRTIR